MVYGLYLVTTTIWHHQPSTVSNLDALPYTVPPIRDLHVYAHVYPCLYTRRHECLHTRQNTCLNTYAGHPTQGLHVAAGPDGCSFASKLAKARITKVAGAKMAKMAKITEAKARWTDRVRAQKTVPPNTFIYTKALPKQQGMQGGLVGD